MSIEETVQDGRKHGSQDKSENPHGRGADLWCHDYAADSDNAREPTQRKRNEQANNDLSQLSPLPEPAAGTSHLRGMLNSTSMNKTCLSTNLFHTDQWLWFHEELMAHKEGMT